ncbi:MAG: dimethylaniline monooxygenase (N-oxide forming) [Hyphomicrobiaceae bacterium]|jgi:dimethylaniline monooxygenase (N-oxide forming)
MPKSVGIVGAGAAGICGARHMLAQGFDVTIYEIGSHIGGMWVFKNDNNRSSAYKTLHINTARDLTAFEGFEFEKTVQPFPDHRDMAKYLRDYAEHFGITKRVRFNTTVMDIRPARGYAPENPRWVIEIADGETIEHDSVIVATGHLTKPLEVDLFRDEFKGEYLHSHHYKEPAKFADKKVCVVGVGNSGLDIASDICTTAERTVLVGRTTPMVIPKLIFGRPFWDAVKPFYKPWVPAAVRSRVLQFLVWVMHGRMTGLGFGTQQKKVHASSNANIINHIHYRRVIAKSGIDKIEGTTLTFADGSSEEFDCLIAATGYLIDLDFIQKEIIEPKDNSLELYHRIVPPDWRGLYFLAFFNSDTALNWICNEQAKWIAEFETARAALPTKVEMRDEIAQRQDWMAKNFEVSPRHGIEVEHLPYFDQLKKSLKASRVRARDQVEIG